MNLKFKRNVLFLSATILIASMSVIISSCSSDEDASDKRFADRAYEVGVESNNI